MNFQVESNKFDWTSFLRFSSIKFCQPGYLSRRAYEMKTFRCYETILKRFESFEFARNFQNNPKRPLKTKVHVAKTFKFQKSRKLMRNRSEAIFRSGG